MSNTPTKPSRLKTFFRKVRKWGFWGIIVLAIFWAWRSYGNMLTGDGVIEGNIAHPENQVVTSKIVTECEIKARVSKEYSYSEIAKIEKFYNKIGAKVKKGDLLVQLSSDAINQKYDGAKKNLDDARTNLASLKEEVRTSKLLYQKDLESQASFVEKKKNLEKFESEKYRQTLAEFEIVAKEKARLNIYADFDGYITEQSKFDGDLVIKDEAIIIVSKLDDLYARFYVSRIYRNNIREGMVVTYFSGNDVARKKTIGTGTINLVSTFIAKKGILVEMTFKPDSNEDVSNFLNQKILAEIRLSETPKKVLAIPIGAVYSDEKGYFVFSVTDGKTERIPVEIGTVGYDSVELKTSLPRSEKILVDPKIYPSSGMAFKRRAN